MRWLLFFLWNLCACCWALPPVPGIEGHITSRGSQVTPEQKKRLDELLGRLQEESRVDLAILIMDQELGSGTLDEMAFQTFHAWGIGKSWENGGALLVLQQDCQAMAVVQSEPERPFREKHRTLIRDTILFGIRQDGVYKGLEQGIVRAARVFRSGGKTYLSAPTQIRDVAASRRYALGALIVFLAALISTRVLER